MFSAQEGIYGLSIEWSQSCVDQLNLTLPFLASMEICLAGGPVTEMSRGCNKC